MGQEPKKHHSLSKTFLKGFSKEEQIYLFDKNKQTVIGPKNIKNVAFAPHLYTVFYNGKRSYKVEDYFQRIETKVGNILKKIRQRGFSEHLSDEEIKCLIFFICALTQRSPAFVNAAEFFKKSLEFNKIYQTYVAAHTCDNLDFLKNSKGGIFASTLIPSINLWYDRFINNFDIYFLTSLSDKAFIINDMMLSAEISLLNSDGNCKLNHLKTVWHFPITSYHCISFVPINNSKNTCKVIYKDMSSRDVRTINKMAFSQKNEQAYCVDKDILESMMS